MGKKKTKKKDKENIDLNDILDYLTKCTSKGHLERMLTIEENRYVMKIINNKTKQVLTMKLTDEEVKFNKPKIISGFC